MTTLIPALFSGGNGGGGIAARSEEEFTRVKIALRGVENKRKEQNKLKNILSMNSDEDNTVAEQVQSKGESQGEFQDDKVRVDRWRGSTEGLEEIANKLKRRREAGSSEEKRPVSVRYQF